MRFSARCFVKRVSRNASRSRVPSSRLGRGSSYLGSPGESVEGSWDGFALKIHTTTLSDVLLIEPMVHGDHRGFFLETYRANLFAEAGIPTDFVQDNASRSVKNTLRGLHYQEPHAQGKLVRVTLGSVFDVAVDARRGSPTFGQWYGCELSEENKYMLWIPPGFAHGFCVLSEMADFSYKCTEYYHPETEGTILWNDPDIGIEWPVGTPLLSEKDRKGKRLSQAETLPIYKALQVVNNAY